MIEEPIKRLMGDGKRRVPGPARQQELVAAAFHRLAADGFEGLRMRTIANDVGVNIATLHYHFATKEDLVRGVVEYTQQRFRTTMPAPDSTDQRLRDHLLALRRLLTSEPELGQVLAEIALRAFRDPAIAGIIRTTNENWYATLRALIEGGMADGSLDPGLDPAGTATLIMVTIKGLCLGATDDDAAEPLARAFDQLDHWLATG